jgi:periplasmic protein TonB
MTPASRIGGAVTLALHAAAVAALLSYEPARSALAAAAPIFVEFLSPPRPEQKKPEPVVAAPKPRAVAKRAPPRVVAPIPEAPAASATPPPPVPVAAAPVAAPPPVTVTAPIFNADYLQNPAPPYPPMSRRLREEGRVLLRVQVSTGGAATQVELRESSGHPRLDEAALEAVRRWRFVPARRGAEPVAAWVLVPISFRLEG